MPDALGMEAVPASIRMLYITKDGGWIGAELRRVKRDGINANGAY